MVGGLRILGVALIAEVRRDGVEPVRLGWAQHLQHSAIVLVTVVDGAQRDLPEGGFTAGAVCLFLGLGQGRQEQGGKNGDDSNDHQQFDQGKPG